MDKMGDEPLLLVPGQKIMTKLTTSKRLRKTSAAKHVSLHPDAQASSGNVQGCMYPSAQKNQSKIFIVIILKYKSYLKYYNNKTS